MNLKRVVNKFRKGILNGGPSDHRCWMVCAPLQGYLKMLGHELKLVEGEFCGAHHVWLEREDGTVIDPTMDQFSGSTIRLPKVYIGPRLPQHKT